MLPVTDSPPSEAQPLNQPDSYHRTTLSGKLTSLKSAFLHLSPLHRFLLFLFLLSFQLLFLLSPRSSSSSSSSSPLLRLRRHHRPPPPSPSPSSDQSCSSGRVFVYELPSKFNLDLTQQCNELNPWTSRCNALSNGGFGPSAASDLSGVVPDSLLPSWFSTDQFAGEVIFHRRILSHPCRTLDPNNATAIYIPFYAGLAVGKHLWSANSSGEERDRESSLLLSWIQEQEPWTKRSYGRDHFIMLGRITWDFRRSREGDWGGSFLYMPGMENVTRLLIERDPWDDKDVGIPYPTGFHPKTEHEVGQWQNFVMTRPRSKLFSFAGAARANIKNDFRGLLLDECAKAGNATCGSVDCGGGKCGNRSRETVNLFLDSKFCLQPRGDSFTRRSMFDCMVAGAVPVIFWKRSAYVQYVWYLPEAREWSVFVDRKEVRNGKVSIRKVLEGIGEEKVRRMRERVVSLIPRLVYGGAEDGIAGGRVWDAVDVAVDGVLRRFREQGQKRRRGDGE